MWNEKIYCEYQNMFWLNWKGMNQINGTHAKTLAVEIMHDSDWWSMFWSFETRLACYSMCVKGLPMKVLGCPRFERHRGVSSTLGRKHIWSFLCLFHRKSLRELAENALPTFTAGGKQWRPASRSILRQWINNIWTYI